MAIRSVILFIGVYFVFVKAADPEHGKLGGKITLVPTVTGKMDEILWKHKGNQVVEFDGSQNKEFGSYVGRTVLDFVTGELIISDLTAEDSGHYEFEAYINNLPKYSHHQVEVIAEVAQPTIICVVNDTKTTASMATLLCIADLQDQQSPMTYSWEGLEGTLLSSSSIDQKLSIVVKDRHDEAVFQCSVSNLVSKKQAQFQVKNCFTDESSSTVLAVCLSLLCLVILLILAVLAFWFYKRHKKAEPALNKQDNVENPAEQRHVKEKGKHFERLARQQTPTKGRLDDQNGTEPALNKQDDEDDPLLPGHVKEKGKHFERLARQQTPTKGRLNDQNGNKKQENIERTEGNSTLPSTQALLQQAQSEEKRSGPPSPSQASMIQSDQNILQPGQETVPDQDPAEPVEIILPDQKSVVAACESITTSTQPSAECNRSDSPSPSQASMTQSDQNILQPGQETVPDQDPAEPVEVSFADQESVVAASESITTSTQPSAECNTSDSPSPSQASMTQSDHNISQPGQETVPDQDPAEPVTVTLADHNSGMASITKEPTDPAIPDPEPEGPALCPTKQDTGAEETRNQKQPDADILGKTGLLTNPNNPTQAGSEPEAPKNQFDTNTEATSEVPAKGHQVENSESCSTSPGGKEGDKDGLKEAENEIEPRNGETNDETNDDRIDKDAMDQNGEEAIKKTEQKKEHSSQFSTLSPKDDQINGSTLDTVAVSKPTELSQDQPEPDDSKAVRDLDLCQQEPNSQSGSISTGEVVGSEKGSKEAEEEMEVGDVEKEIPEGGGDHSIRIDGNMKTDDKENKKSFVEVGDTEHQSMKEEKTGTDESAEQHPDPGEKADVSSQSETVETAGVKNNADKEQDDKNDRGGIKVDSPMEGAGSDEQGDSNEENAKGTEQGETVQKLED